MAKLVTTGDSLKRQVVVSAPGVPHLARGQTGYVGRGGPNVGITPQFVLNTLRQWWKVATPVGIVLAAGVASLIWFSFKPQYEAIAWLRIEDVEPRLLNRTGDESRKFVATQTELLRSPLVIGPAVSNSDVARVPEIRDRLSPIAWLGSQISVRSVGGSELFNVSFACGDASDAANVVNAVVDSYMTVQRGNAAERGKRIVGLLTLEKERRAEEVKRLRNVYKQLYEQAWGENPFAAGPSNETVLVQHPLAELQRQLTDAEVSVEITKAQIQVFEEEISGGKIEVPEAMLERTIEVHPSVQELTAQIKDKQTKLVEIERLSAKGKADPFYVELEGTIRQDQQDLEQLRSQLRPQVQDDVATALKSYRQEQLDQMRSELRSQQIRTETFRTRFKEEAAKLPATSGETVELEFARAELGQAQEVLNRIDARLELLHTEQGAPDRVSLLQKAEPPSAPIEATAYKKMAMAVVACLCAPFGLAFLWERVVRRVSDSENLEQNSNLAVIGEVARLPVRRVGGRGSWGDRAGQSRRLFEESIDSLRTNLVLSEAGENTRVIAVTSAANHEGKTSVAAQLAVSLARSTGKLTLLIDGDLRSPDMHNLFELPVSPGLAEVLDDSCSLEDAIATSWSPTLHIVAAGKVTASPHKLFGNGAVNRLLEKLPSCYEYVVIDTPPVLAAGEALVIAKVADATLVCAMRDVSRADQVRRACQRLHAAGARAVGTVLNGVPTKRYAYYYGSYADSRG